MKDKQCICFTLVGSFKLNSANVWLVFLKLAEIKWDFKFHLLFRSIFSSVLFPAAEQ